MTKENKTLQWSLQISGLLLLLVVAEWNARSSCLALYSSAISGCETERELLFSVGVNCPSRTRLVLLHEVESVAFSA